MLPSRGRSGARGKAHLVEEPGLGQDSPLQSLSHGGVHSCFLSPVSRATHWRWEMRLQFGAQRDQLLSSGSKRADQGERY